MSNTKAILNSGFNPFFSASAPILDRCALCLSLSIWISSFVSIRPCSCSACFLICLRCACCIAPRFLFNAIRATSLSCFLVSVVATGCTSVSTSASASFAPDSVFDSNWRTSVSTSASASFAPDSVFDSNWRTSVSTSASASFAPDSVFDSNCPFLRLNDPT